MRLEYIILIILAVGFFHTNIIEYRKDKNRETFVNDNLKVSSKVMTKSGLIGYVSKINKNEIIIITGDGENTSHITIDKSFIDNILE
ncbi:preprotein translocase subunit YajC [uncultured Anaerococcus sp.]|uniref:preprotein translocase subunit YajC n=1 Tax=uncultured Anaerococcus sp. TaxID=293428 RepID=UPI00260A4160|nr:preprotein translocase subunit YajC [uncultured Anaerococcus sp.]